MAEEFLPSQEGQNLIHIEIYMKNSGRSKKRVVLLSGGGGGSGRREEEVMVVPP